MNFKKTTIQCPCCKKEFMFEHYHGGSIEHENMLSNMNVLVSRWDSDYDKDDLFTWAINLDGTHSSIKDHTIKVGRDIFSCVLIWLQQHGKEDIYEYFKGREKDIGGKYNGIRYKVIADLQEQIREEEGKIITEKEEVMCK